MSFIQQRYDKYLNINLNSKKFLIFVVLKQNNHGTHWKDNR